MNNTGSRQSGKCVELMTMAERELAAFLNAVTELYGTEEAEMAAEIWLEELQAMNNLPGPAIRDWRKVTVSALSRLASRLTAARVPAIPLSECSGPVQEQRTWRI